MLVAAAFFWSFWGGNAAGLGRGDLGLAAGLAFAVPLTLYTSLGIAALALAGAVAAALCRRRIGPWLAALLIALLPWAFLALLDLL